MFLKQNIKKHSYIKSPTIEILEELLSFNDKHSELKLSLLEYQYLKEDDSEVSTVGDKIGKAIGFIWDNIIRLLNWIRKQIMKIFGYIIIGILSFIIRLVRSKYGIDEYVKTEKIEVSNIMQYLLDYSKEASKANDVNELKNIEVEYNEKLQPFLIPYVRKVIKIKVSEFSNYIKEIKDKATQVSKEIDTIISPIEEEAKVLKRQGDRNKSDFYTYKAKSISMYCKNVSDIVLKAVAFLKKLN